MQPEKEMQEIKRNDASMYHADDDEDIEVKKEQKFEDLRNRAQKLKNQKKQKKEKISPEKISSAPLDAFFDHEKEL